MPHPCPDRAGIFRPSTALVGAVGAAAGRRGLSRIFREGTVPSRYRVAGAFVRSVCSHLVTSVGSGDGGVIANTSRADNSRP